MIAAVRSMAVFLVCAITWVLTGGSTMMIMMMIMPVLFGQIFAGAPGALTIVQRITVGSAAAIPVAAVIGLGTLASGTGSFEMLVLLFCAPLFIPLIGMTNKDAMPYSLGFCFSFTVLVQPGNLMAFSADQSISTGLGIVFGLLVLQTCFELIGYPRGVFLQNRIIVAIADDLRVTRTTRQGKERFNRHMAERLLYLGSRETGQRHSAQLTVQGLAGQDLGHASLDIHAQCAACPEPRLATCLKEWRIALAQAFLASARGHADERFDRASAQLVAVYGVCRPGSRGLAVLQGAVGRVRSSMDYLRRASHQSQSKRACTHS